MTPQEITLCDQVVTELFESKQNEFKNWVEYKAKFGAAIQAKLPNQPKDYCEELAVSYYFIGTVGVLKNVFVG